MVAASSGSGVRVPGIPEQISQALFHVVLNAVQNSPPDTEVRVDFAVEDGTLTIEAVDAGTGIEPKVEGRLSEPFVISHKGRQGLGLALARHFVEAHGGMPTGEKIRPVRVQPSGSASGGFTGNDPPVPARRDQASSSASSAGVFSTPRGFAPHGPSSSP